MQEFMRNDDVVVAAISPACIGVDDTVHAFLHTDRVFQGKRSIRAVIAHEYTYIRINPVLILGDSRDPPSHLQRPQHDAYDPGRTVGRRRLFADRLTDFNAQGPHYGLAVALGFARNE